MNWNNIKKNKCPKCGRDLVKNETGLIKCFGNTDLKRDCDFHIWESRFKELTTTNAETCLSGKEDYLLTNLL